MRTGRVQARGSRARAGGTGRAGRVGWGSAGGGGEAGAGEAEWRRHAGELKGRLRAAVAGSGRGTRATASQRADVAELVSQLEALNPSASGGRDEISLLEGTWRLVWTGTSELFAFLLADQLPLVDCGEITQKISAVRAGTGGEADFEVTNRVELGLPGVRGALSNTGEVRLRSDRTVEVKFVSGRVEAPELTPAEGALAGQDIFGRTVDLSSLEGALTVAQRAAGAIAGPASEALGLQDGLSFDTPSGGATWLLTSYLDEDLRISRGDGGGLFVLTKEP